MPNTPKETLETMLRHLGFEVTVEQHDLEGTPLLNALTDDNGRLIGREGQTLGDLQYITNRLLFTQDLTAPKVMVDVGGFRTQARVALVQRAKEGADKVRRGGDVVELEPMNAFDRRVVHQAIKDDPDIETFSVEVEGTERKAILLRRKQARA